MDGQLALFNLIDNAPMVPVEPVSATAAPTIGYQPSPTPAPITLKSLGLKILDLVVILPFTHNGTPRGEFLKTPGVIVGFTSTGMVQVDVGTGSNFYEASPWRIVKMDV